MTFRMKQEWQTTANRKESSEGKTFYAEETLMYKWTGNDL